MGEPIKASVEGTIRAGELTGYRVRIEDDFQESGGFLIVFESTEDPNVGGDYWVETFQDLLIFFDEANWDVHWDEPLEQLRR